MGRISHLFIGESMDYCIKKVAVIGGGAAGLMAAGTATRYGAEVTIFEHTGRLGKKLAITGKGRCNVTNQCSIDEFLQNVPTNPRFLYAALNAFSPEDTISLFEELGVGLKVERGRRVFPESDRAIDIVNAMKDYARDARVLFQKVNSITKNSDGTFSVITEQGTHIFDSVILATGGRSYPLTGSDGSGHRLARKLGHTITPLFPSLVPLQSPSHIPEALQGLALKNIGVKLIKDGTRVLYEDFGELLFTHFGVSGPVILSASSHLNRDDFKNLTLAIDLKPALDEQTLDKRLIHDFDERANKDFLNALDALLPSKMISIVVSLSGIDPHKKVNSITKEERTRLLHILKEFTLPISSPRPIEEAIVTSGGVCVREISPKTMESKLVDGLYFAGEVIDVDAYTGGYNLQIAFSTAYLAAINAAQF